MLTFRPAGPWTDPDTDPRLTAAFRASHEDTLALLRAEARALDAPAVVIEADFTPGDIRADGLPRARARTPVHPGVRVSFESRHGPLLYRTDTFTTWEANLRAVALSLEALRKVDRYGVASSGQQYRGWAQLGPGTGQPASGMTRDVALALLAEHGRHPSLAPGTAAEVLARAYKLAQFTTHPDRNGGDSADFHRVVEAGRLLGARPVSAPEMLSEAERRAMDLSAELIGVISTEIVTSGPNRDNDLLEFALHIHAIQNMLLAQAAARAYPGRYRLLGQSLHTDNHIATCHAALARLGLVDAPTQPEGPR